MRYCPFPPLVTELNVPADVPPALLKVTKIPELMGLLFASRMVAVTVTVLPAATVADDVAIVDVTALATPGTTETVTAERGVAALTLF